MYVCVWCGGEGGSSTLSEHTLQSKHIVITITILCLYTIHTLFRSRKTIPQKREHEREQKKWRWKSQHKQNSALLWLPPHMNVRCRAQRQKTQERKKPHTHTHKHIFYSHPPTLTHPRSVAANKLISEHYSQVGICSNRNKFFSEKFPIDAILFILSMLRIFALFYRRCQAAFHRMWSLARLPYYIYS